MIGALKDVVGSILGRIPEPEWEAVKLHTAVVGADFSYLEKVLQKVGAAPSTPPAVQASLPPASALTQELSAAFPGRDIFCRRMASVMEVTFRLWQSTRRPSGDTPGLTPGKSPNVLILGGRGVGKTYLLSQVLPAAVPAFLETTAARNAPQPFVAYIDARHLGQPSVDHPFGPVPLAQMLALCSNVAPEVWATDRPALICIDHLESVWSAKGPDHHLTHPPESRCAALAAVLRGVRVPIPGAEPHPGRRTPPPSLDTGRVLFVAVADLPELRTVLDKRAGPVGTVAVTAEHLEAAGMPGCLIAEFPVVLCLPPLSREAYRLLLEQQAVSPTHAGFLLLKQLADALECALSFEPDAIEQLLGLTFNGLPRFHHLEQLLTGIAEMVHTQARAKQPLAITGLDVTQIQERNKVLPVEASRKR
jgi:hypothetical protein